MNGIDGIWDCTLSVPTGKESAELKVQAAADGSVTGSLTNLVDGQCVDLKEGRLDGNNLSWTMQLVKPFKLTVKCEVMVEGNTINGHGKAMIGKVPITGTKRA
jgi:hypothetical protein